MHGADAREQPVPDRLVDPTGGAVRGRDQSLTAPQPRARQQGEDRLEPLEADHPLQEAARIPPENDRLAGASARPYLESRLGRERPRHEVLGIALELVAFDQGEAGDVLGAGDVGRGEAERAHGLAVVGDVLVGVGHGGAQAAALGALDRLRRSEGEARLERGARGHLRRPQRPPVERLGAGGHARGGDRPSSPGACGRIARAATKWPVR
jgi:hypothetical protein